MRKIDWFTASCLSLYICAKAELCLCNMYMYVVYELQHVCKDVAVLLCICKLQCVDDCIVIFYFLFFIFSFFIKCMQSMTMTLSRRCAYVRLHVSWSKSLLYIFSLINHIDSLCKQALSIKQLLSLMLSFSRLFVFFSLYSFVLSND